MNTFMSELSQPYDIDWTNPDTKGLLTCQFDDGVTVLNALTGVTGEVFDSANIIGLAQGSYRVSATWLVKPIGIDSDPFSLFKTVENEQQEYGLVLELPAHVITIDFVGSYTGEITYADGTVSAISGTGTFTLDGTSAITIKKITAVHIANVNELFIFNRTKGDSVKSELSALTCTLSGFPSSGGYVRGADGNIAGYKTPNREKFHIKATGLPIKSGLKVKLHLLEDIDLTGTYKRIFDSVDGFISTGNGGATDFSSNVSDQKIDGIASNNLFNAKAGQVISFVVDVNSNGEFYFLGSRYVSDSEATGTTLSLIEVFDGEVLVASYDCKSGDSDEIFNTVSTDNAIIHNVVTAKWQPIFPTNYFIVGLEPYHDFANLKSFIDSRSSVTTAWQFAAMDYLQVGNGGGTLWHTNADNKVILGAVKGKEFDGNKATAVGYDAGSDSMQFQSPLFMQDVYFNPNFSASGTSEVHASNCLLDQTKRLRTAKNCVVKNAQSYAQIKASDSIFLESVSSNGNPNNYVDLTNCILLKASNAVTQVNATVSNSLFAQSNLSGVETSIDNTANVDFTNAFVDSANDDWRINQAWATANAANKGWNGTDIVKWAWKDSLPAVAYNFYWTTNFSGVI